MTPAIASAGTTLHDDPGMSVIMADSTWTPHMRPTARAAAVARKSVSGWQIPVSRFAKSAWRPIRPDRTASTKRACSAADAWASQLSTAHITSTFHLKRAPSG